jgi:hypothetical protein
MNRHCVVFEPCLEGTTSLRNGVHWRFPGLRAWMEKMRCSHDRQALTRRLIILILQIVLILIRQTLMLSSLLLPSFVNPRVHKSSPCRPSAIKFATVCTGQNRPIHTYCRPQINKWSVGVNNTGFFMTLVSLPNLPYPYPCASDCLVLHPTAP